MFRDDRIGCTRIQDKVGLGSGIDYCLHYRCQAFRFERDQGAAGIRRVIGRRRRCQPSNSGSILSKFQRYIVLIITEMDYFPLIHPAIKVGGAGRDNNRQEKEKYQWDPGKPHEHRNIISCKAPRLEGRGPGLFPQYDQCYANDD